jgi:hypothetical protein
VVLGYTFWQAIWTVIVIFAWVVLFWLIITVLSDVFRRHDIGGWKKAMWCLFVIFLPLIGVLSYMIINGGGIAERNVKQVQASQAEFDQYVKSVASSASPTDQIAQAKKMLDDGTITQTEYEQLKQKALA